MYTFLGEDRWLCTLLLQQGWRVEYNAASDAYTNSLTKEFYNQRRRWGPSTLANTLELLHRLLLLLMLLVKVKIPSLAKYLTYLKNPNLKLTAMLWSDSIFIWCFRVISTDYTSLLSCLLWYYDMYIVLISTFLWLWQIAVVQRQWRETLPSLGFTSSTRCSLLVPLSLVQPLWLSW